MYRLFVGLAFAALSVVAAKAQENVSWPPAIELSVPAGILKRVPTEVFGVKLGMTPDQVLAGFTVRYPDPRHTKMKNATQLSLPVPTIVVPKYISSIVAKFDDGTKSEDVAFGFTSPLTGNKLVAIQRRTDFKNLNDLPSFPTADQAAQTFLELLGRPTRNSGTPSPTSGFPQVISWMVNKGRVVPPDDQAVVGLCDLMYQSVLGGMAPNGPPICNEIEFSAEAWLGDNLGAPQGRFSIIKMTVADITAVRRDRDLVRGFIAELNQRAANKGGGATYRP